MEADVQVIGRIVRHHALPQERSDLPDLLDRDYAFFANAASQEGLLDAGAQINALTTHAPETGTQTVITVIGDTAQVPIARSGEPLSLLVTSQAVQTEGNADDAVDVTADESGDPVGGERELWVPTARDLLQMAGETGANVAPLAAGNSSLSLPSLARESLHRYPRYARAPPVLRSERLPPAPSDFEARLVDSVDFAGAVLNSRTRRRERVSRDERVLFQRSHIGEDGKDLFADPAPEAVAERAEQIRLKLRESNDRELHVRLLDRFRTAIESAGATAPEDGAELLQQPDLPLVRHPGLLETACRRMRHGPVVEVDTPLPIEQHSDMRLEPARRALYWVMLPGLNEDEKAVSTLMDGSPLVQWWHRNPSDFRKP